MPVSEMFCDHYCPACNASTPHVDITLIPLESYCLTCRAWGSFFGYCGVCHGLTHHIIVALKAGLGHDVFCAVCGLSFTKRRGEEVIAERPKDIAGEFFAAMREEQLPDP